MGKGASAAGLLHKDPMTREWTLEGGALVLAERAPHLLEHVRDVGPEHYLT
jgi:DNA replication licensing factor MCM2